MSIPKVTVGLPVYNGENYLAQAIESVLAQTLSDFELIISDNGSTDSTQVICEKYAAQDARICYLRSEVNRGAGWNFREVFVHARGRYFKWAAHDDLMAETMLADCAAVLDVDTDVVLAWPRNVLIDEKGDELGDYNSSLRTDSADSLTRFRDLLLGHRCFEIFGLLRSSALAQTEVMGDYGHSDGVVLAHLGLLGRFRYVSTTAFYARRHNEQSMSVYGVYDNTLPDYERYTAWFAPHKSNQLVMPHFRIMFEFARTVVQTKLPISALLRGWWLSAHWGWRMRRYMFYDVVNVIKELSRKGNRLLRRQKALPRSNVAATDATSPDQAWGD